VKAAGGVKATMTKRALLGTHLTSLTVRGRLEMRVNIRKRKQDENTMASQRKAGRGARAWGTCLL
jgi:hypothetical protein